MRGLKDKIAIVTGGPGLIGRPTCRRLAEEGCKIMIADLNLEGAQAVADELTADGLVAKAVSLDLTSEKSVKSMIDTTVAEYGTVDILVNLAYGAQLLGEDTTTPFTSMTPEFFLKTMETNALGYALTMKHVLPVFLKQQSGVIVNTSSIDAIQGNPCRHAYSASKAAIMSFAQNIACTYGQMGIRCNTILPGHIMPDGMMEAYYPGELGTAMKNSLMVPYVGSGSYIASVIAFFASDDSKFINGAQLAVDGGIRNHFAMQSLIRGQEGKESQWWSYPKPLVPEDYPDGWE